MYEIVYRLKLETILLVIGCSFHTAVAVDIWKVVKSRRVRIIRKDMIYNVRKALKIIERSKSMKLYIEKFGNKILKIETENILEMVLKYR